MVFVLCGEGKSVRIVMIIVYSTFPALSLFMLIQYLIEVHSNLSYSKVTYCNSI